jgi:transposase-like protein
MLLVLDPSTTALELAAGALVCRENGCDGVLGPWGHARTRWLRLGPGRSEAHTPRRARCRSCGRTHVLVPARSYPRRPDTVETVGAALLAAVGGLGYRRVAEAVGVPATTVRGWLQRARANSETIRVNATIAGHALDPMAARIDPTGTPLGDMVEAVGRAVAADIRRLGPGHPPWQLASVITRAGILAPRPRRIIWYPFL